MIHGAATTRRLVLQAAGVLLLPRAAWAQPSRQRRIAILSAGTHISEEALWEAFRRQLHALGYGDADIAIESRYADGYGGRLPGLAAELVRLNPEIIVTRGTAATKAAKEATATIPIVMANAGDPIRAGLVAGLAHPGGNVTGMSTMQEDFAAKEMELLLSVVPGAKRIAVLVNPDNPTHAGELNSVRDAARSLGVTSIEVRIRSPDEVDGAFATMTRERAGALFILGDAFFFAAASRIAGLAASQKLPAIYDHGGFPAVGGLMGYGPDRMEMFRRAAAYVDDILKGAKPADLPVQQPTKFELVINLKTAKALGLIVPQSILAGADEVIE